MRAYRAPSEEQHPRVPNVFSTLKPFAIRLVLRIILVARHKKHALATAHPLTLTQIVHVVSTSSTPITDSRLVVFPRSGHVEPSPIVDFGHVAKSCGETKETAKDVLLLGLEALAQPADAFPLLKSAVGGLLFLTKQIELVPSEKEQILDIFAQIDGFAASLVRAIPDATALSPAYEAAIQALAKDIQAESLDVEAIVRQHSVAHFLRAKRHSGQLDQLMRCLDQADKSFNRTMLPTVEIRVLEIRECVLPLREVHRLARIGEYFF
ncbi:unnamed protein product [Peniophora sp. CBMAI 1063]|nr:unnamed protein product [Peniophora sp. CBMAI 1063]